MPRNSKYTENPIIPMKYAEISGFTFILMIFIDG